MALCASNLTVCSPGPGDVFTGMFTGSSSTPDSNEWLIMRLIDKLVPASEKTNGFTMRLEPPSSATIEIQLSRHNSQTFCTSSIQHGDVIYV